MTRHAPSFLEPPIEDLLDRVDSKFTLVTLTARRARQLTIYFSQLGQGLGTIVPPQTASLSQKPVSIALEEIVNRRIVPVYKTDTDEPDGDGNGDAAPTKTG